MEIRPYRYFLSTASRQVDLWDIVYVLVSLTTLSQIGCVLCKPRHPGRSQFSANLDEGLSLNRISAILTATFTSSCDLQSGIDNFGRCLLKKCVRTDSNSIPRQTNGRRRIWNENPNTETNSKKSHHFCLDSPYYSAQVSCNVRRSACRSKVRP